MGEIVIFGESDLPMLTMKGTGYTGRNYSVYHLKSASIFIEKVRDIENNYTVNSVSGSLIEEHRTSVVAATFFICASLEATINEIIHTVSSEHYDNEGDRNLMLSFIDVWEVIEKEKYLPFLLRDSNVLDKYQYVLKALKKEVFNTSISPYQDISNCLFLRNALIHYKIDDHKTQNNIRKRIESKIKKYGKHPFVSESANFFPYKCLCYGCLKYFSETFISFTAEFHDKIGLSWMAEQQKEILLKGVVI